MKYPSILVAVLFLLASCSDNPVPAVPDSAESRGEQPVTYNWTPAPRDSSITPESAWSDLFLDSATLSAFILKNGVQDTAANALRHFYNRRNYGFAWLTTQGLTEQGRGLWNRSLKGSPDGKAATAKGLLDSLLMKDTVQIAATDTLVQATELRLTLKFIKLWNSELRYHTAFALNDPMAYVPAKREDPLKMAEVLVAGGGDTAAASTSTSLFDPQRQYVLLRNQLKKYLDNSKGGGLLPLTSSAAGTRKSGASGRNDSALKQHLYLHGFLSEADTASRSADVVTQALKRAQSAFGLDTSGRLSDSLLTSLNQPIPDKIAQLVVNMNRLLWIEPYGTKGSVVVNIPEFRLRVVEAGDTVFTMPVIVGKEGATTLQFGGNMNEVVFNPYWNIPQSIGRNEILPASKKDKDYLKRQRIERVGGSDEAPQFRQLPGRDNSLGLVKFLFPNNYDIYLHDTPVKDAFSRDARALSHGCIRLSDARKMAEYVLRNDGAWSPEKIGAAMNGGSEKRVAVKDPVPVRITYLTAMVNGDGQLQFFNDVYRLDEKQYAAMFRMSPRTAAGAPSTPDTAAATRPL